MIENQSSAARPITVRQVRKRRDSKSSYRNGSGSSRFHHAVDARTASRSPGSPSSPRNGRIAPSSSQDSLFTFEGFDALNLASPPPVGDSYFASSGQQNDPFEEGWGFQSMGSLPMGSPTQFSSPVFEGPGPAIPFGGYPSEIQSNGLEFFWNGVTPSTSYAGSDMEMSMSSGAPFGSYGSMILGTPDTASTSVSGNWVMPIPDCGPDSLSGMIQVNDLVLSPAYYETGLPPNFAAYNTSNENAPLGDFSYDRTFSPELQGRLFGEIYERGDAQLSTATLIQQDIPQFPDRSTMTDLMPWNSQQAQLNERVANANAGLVGFEPDRGVGYQIHLKRQRYLDDTGQQFKAPTFGPEPVNMVSKSENDSLMDWSGDSSYAISHGSPFSFGSPLSYAASPLQAGNERHSHMLTGFLEPEETKPKNSRRKLSPTEKVEAKDVRECKACWACHVSKTKCSPCEPGRPCRPCAELALKRRFCKFTCFNDPLETLINFWIPDWFMGHFTQAHVESFIAENAARWGTQNFRVRLSWGYRKPVEADVVTIELRDNGGQMAVSNQAVSVNGGRPQLVRRKSPPLGVPLGSMMELQAVSAQYTQRIVDDDLMQYVKITYDDQGSPLAERLLGAIATFYRANARAGRKSELLCQAIEMHITFTILERSLVLDSESLEQVQNQLRQAYPARAVPRCAQRQIKLAFYLIQRQRIERVLKTWSDMMWQIKDKTRTQKEWALSFCVFTMLTLALDKIFGAAYYFCEGNIANHGGEPVEEQRQLYELVTLAEREFFERCKEIFHWKFKTRKTGGCNPLRYGLEVFREWTVDSATEGLVGDLRAIVGEFETKVRTKRSWRADPPDEDVPYLDAGRLACIFLDDFLDH